MHGIHPSVIWLPLLLNRDSVKLPLKSLELLYMFPISHRDGRTGCSKLCCRLHCTFGCRFGHCWCPQLFGDLPPGCWVQYGLSCTFSGTTLVQDALVLFTKDGRTLDNSNYRVLHRTRSAQCFEGTFSEVGGVRSAMGQEKGGIHEL